MIDEELRALRKYIVSECKVNCGIGLRDISSDDYPYVEILPVNPIPLYYNTSKLFVMNMEVTLRITVDRKNEIEAFDVLERLLKKVLQFNRKYGHSVEPGAEAVPEYDEDNTTYMISVPFILKLTAQDT